jgi:hypothetical protein
MIFTEEEIEIYYHSKEDWIVKYLKWSCLI